jgi:hypothetical protein
VPAIAASASFACRAAPTIMCFEALFEALFDVMQPPEGSIPPPLPGQIGVPFRRPCGLAPLGHALLPRSVTGRDRRVSVAVRVQSLGFEGLFDVVEARKRITGE